MPQKLKLVPEDVCEARHKSILDSITNMRTDVRLLSENFDRHKMKSIECTSKLGVCMTATKKSIDGLQTDVNTLVANCTKTTQTPEHKGGIYMGKAVALKILSVVSGALLLIYVIVFKGDSELVTSSAINLLGG